MIKRMIIGALIGVIAGLMFNPHPVSLLICAVAGAYFAKKYVNRPPAKAFDKLFNPKMDIPEPPDDEKQDSDDKDSDKK